MEQGTENWKIGSILVYESSLCSGRRKIIRETTSTWVLDDGIKIKKGFRNPIGERGFGTRHFYSIEEEEGKKILDSIQKESIIYWIKNHDYKNLSTDNLRKIKNYIMEIK